MRRFLVCLAAVSLSACSSLPQSISVDDPEAAWAQRQAELKGIRYFRIAGRMSIANGVEVWQVSVFWQQRGDDFQIQLSGPFGSGKVQLSGSHTGDVKLQTGEGTFRATSADRLLYEQTGVTMPVSGLRYWLLGLPDPNLAEQQHSLDAAGRLARLNHADWDVLLKRYVNVNGMDLPNKIFVSKDDVEVRLVIDKWSLGLS
jgi:outer membrane lipoprotein LolB